MKNFKLNALLQIASLLRIPLLGFMKPRVVELTPERSIVRVKLNYITRNHVGSMYFGALAMGAELSIGVKVFEKIQMQKAPVNFLFKDFDCQFHRKAQTDVDFCFLNIKAVEELIERVITTGEKAEGRFEGFALEKGQDPFVAKKEDKLMTYGLTLAVKKKSSSSGML